MPIDSIEFVTIAQDNLDRDSGEIGCRTAVSRAYYGMYHSCLELTGPVPRQHPLNGVFKGGNSLTSCSVHDRVCRIDFSS